MDSRAILQQAVKAAGCDAAQGSRLAEAFATALRERLCALDAVAIPGFGSFVPEKSDEYVAVADDGTRTLMPPHIGLTFNAGSMLRKHISSHE